jgi:spermidine synthase
LVDGRVRAYTGDGTSRRAYYPFLLKPHAKNALIIGVGSGAAVESALNSGAQDVTLLAEGAEFLKAPTFLSDKTKAALSDPKVKAVNADPSSWLSKPAKKYDVIITGLATMDTLERPDALTVERFLKLKSALAPDGVVAQWIRLASMDLPDFQAALAAFFTAFPEATVWSGDINPVNSWVLLLGSGKPLALEPENIHARLTALEPLDALAEGRNVYSFLSFYIAKAVALAPLTAKAPVHTERNPALFKKLINPADGGSRSAETFLTLVNYRAPVTEITMSGQGPREKLISYYKGRSTLLAGRRVAIAGAADKEAALYDKAVENAPEDPHIALSYMALGLSFYRSGLYDKAATLLEKAKKIAPDKTQIRFYLGKTYEKMGQAAKANAEFKYVRERIPGFMERVYISPKGNMPQPAK